MRLHVEILLLFVQISIAKGFGLSWWTQFMSSAFMSDSLSSWFIRTRCLGVGQNFTYFMYYSRMNVNEPRFLVSGNNELLHSSGFDASRPTKIIIHGFLDCVYVTEWMHKMKTKLLRTGDYNVIIVDWSCGNGLPFAQAIPNSKITANELIKLIEFLRDEVGADPAHFHLIGHSMGTVISALVGQGTPHLGRISALDPPGPRFYKSSGKERLDPNDATFVDVIHSDTGHHLLDGLGLQIRLGHLDFYPNGGKDQPGCRRSPFTLFPKIIRAFRYYFTCDHFQSIEYYIDSIKSHEPFSHSECQFVGVLCGSWEHFEQGKCTDCTQDGNCALMGYNSNLFWNSEAGKMEFYLKTSGEEPFCLFHYKVAVETERKCQTCFNATIGLQSFSFIPGVMRLEVKSDTGRVARLDDNEEKEMIIGRQYVYLATSQFQVEKVTSAEVWFGSVSKPNIEATTQKQLTGVNLKTIRIVPLQMTSNVRTYSLAETTVLCASSEKTIGRSIVLNLNVNEC